MRIPEYDSKVKPAPGLQAPTISPDSAGAAYRGVSQLGESVAALGQQIQEQKDAISRTNELTTRITGAEKDIADLNNQLDQAQDPDTAMATFEEGFSAIRERWMDGVEDSRVLDALTQHFGEREYHEATAVKHKTLKWTIERGQANVIEQLDQYAKFAAMDADAFDRNLDLAYQLLDNAGATGLYSPDKVVELKEKTRKNFFVQRYNQMIQEDPEAAIRNFAWLKQIGDPKKENELLSKAVTWAQRMDTMNDRDFREESGALLNRMIIDINSGRMNRAGVELVVGSGRLTDEHERILMNEISTYEKSPTHSDPERLGYWKQTIEEAALRKDEASLNSFRARIGDDPQITKNDRATLYATLQTKLGKIEGERKEFRDGYREAINVLDRFFGYSPVTGSYFKQANSAPHLALIRKIMAASAGKYKDPKTGKITSVPKVSGWDLTEMAYRLIEEYKKEKDIRDAQSQNAIPEIPPAKEYRR